MCILKPKYLIGNDVRKHFGGIVFTSLLKRYINSVYQAGFNIIVLYYLSNCFSTDPQYSPVALICTVMEGCS